MATIAFVDDDQDVLDVCAIMARLLKYESRSFDDAESALIELVQIPPDVIFSDLTMPRMNGFDFAIALRRHPVLRHIYLVAATSHSSPEYRTAAAHAGFDAYRVKPLTPDDLHGAIEAARSRARQGRTPRVPKQPTRH